MGKLGALAQAVDDLLDGSFIAWVVAVSTRHVENSPPVFLAESQPIHFAFLCAKASEKVRCSGIVHDL